MTGQPIQAINRRIANTDIFVFSYTPQTELFTYSRPFTAQEAAALAEETNQAIKVQYGNAKGLRKGLEANEAGELVNMSTLKGIVANKALMARTKNEQWFPTIRESMQLSGAGLLPSGFLHDAGLALYDARDPDTEIAQALVERAGKQGYALPVLASFKALDLQTGGTRYGVTPQLVSADGLISGEQAQEFLAQHFAYKGDSGVRRLDRDNLGYWDANWGGFDFFDEDCRVGRFSAAGSAQKLEEEALGAFTPIKQSLDEILSLRQQI